MDDKYLAYEKKGEAQHSYIRAASYSDEWVNSNAGRVASYYICLAKTRWEHDSASTCRRLIPSKTWDKMKDDTEEEWVTGQRWYCKCGAKYKAKNGQVVVFEQSDGSLAYVRSECPPWDLEDVRAMKTEATLDPSSVRDLYDKIRSVEPVTNDIISMDASGLKYIKAEADLERMPQFSWAEVLSLQSHVKALL